MIITNNEEALRVKCENVSLEEAYDLIQTLENELNAANKTNNRGIGLAAPQIGIAKKAAIIRIGDYKVNLINAIIDKKYDLKTFQDEGCLSFPGRVETTNRYQEITLINNLLYPHSMILSGLLAVAVQHELDHTNGTLFFDHAIKTKIRPNDLCICNSGKKYKKCCLK